LRAPWVPAARTVSARCKPARLRHARRLVGRFDCKFLSKMAWASSVM
jgi:hypothetical protein